MPESVPNNAFPPKRGNGRPCELTPEMVSETEQLMSRCLYLETIADTLGVHRETFREWAKTGAREQRRRDKGEDPDHKYDLHCQFSATVKKQLAKAETDFLSTIQAAGTQAWTALAWVLERRFPGKWSAGRGELKMLQKRLAELEKQCAPNVKPVHTDEREGGSADPSFTVEDVK